MGWVTDRPMADMYDEDLAERVARRVVVEMGDRMHELIREATPVAEVPEAYKGDRDAFISDRGRRRPGTARASWKLSPIERTPRGLSIEVDSDDQLPNGHYLVDYLEDGTRPHVIRARRAKALRFPMGPSFVFAVQVQHPGTEGLHMVRDSMATVRVELPRRASRILDEEAR